MLGCIAPEVPNIIIYRGSKTQGWSSCRTRLVRRKLSSFLGSSVMPRCPLPPVWTCFRWAKATPSVPSATTIRPSGLRRSDSDARGPPWACCFPRQGKHWNLDHPIYKKYRPAAARQHFLIAIWLCRSCRASPTTAPAPSAWMWTLRRSGRSTATSAGARELIWIKLGEHPFIQVLPIHLTID